MEETWRITLPSSNEVKWSGPSNASPSLTQLSKLLPKSSDGEALNDLHQIAGQIIRAAPVKSIPILLSILCSSFNRNKNGEINVNEIISLQSIDQKRICGYVFAKGDLVWSCRTCGKDPTCVQCDNCYHDSDHVGHEVFFHRAEGNGGCCDCGDEEAWARSGNCSAHGRRETEPQSDEALLQQIPEKLAVAISATIQALLSLTVSYSSCCVRSCESWESNSFRDWAETFNEEMTIRLHNDDVHTYDDVTSALQKVGLSAQAAATLTAAVDKQGEAQAAGSKSPGELEKVFNELHGRGLITSLLPARIRGLDVRLTATFIWLEKLGMKHAGLQRLISKELMTPIGGLPEVPIVEVELEGSNAQRTVRREAAAKLSLIKLFEDSSQFPSLSKVLQADCDPSLYNVGSFCVHKPFLSCPRVSFAVVLCAHAFLCVPLRKTICSMIVSFQQDAFFRAAFTQLITILYPYLSALFVNFYGVSSSDHLLTTVVQFYTAHAVVEALSSEKVESRPFPEPQGAVHLSTHLVASMRNCLGRLGCLPGRKNDAFLTCAAIARHQRLAIVIRDLEYIFESSLGNLRLLSGERDPGLFGELLHVSQLFQGMDEIQRRTSTHIEREDDRWQHSLNLSLQFDHLGVLLIRNAFCATVAFSREIKIQAEKLAPSDSVQQELLVAQLRDMVRNSKAVGLARAVNLTMQSINGQGQDLPPRSKQTYLRFLIDLFPSFSSSEKTDNSVQVLGHLVKFPGKRKFFVSFSKLSVHLPLQRLVAKLIDSAANGSVCLKSVISSLRVSELIPALQALADYPLRVLSFSSQVKVGMWRRNGGAVVNIVYNYCRAPLCRNLRDADIHAIQIASLALGPDAVLALCIDRFEVTGALEMESYFTSPDVLVEYKGPLIGELLRLLCNMMVNIPIGLVDAEDQNESRPIEGLHRALCREGVNSLMGGLDRNSRNAADAKTITFSHLLQIRHNIGNKDDISDAALKTVCDDICQQRVVASSSSFEEKTALELKSESYSFYDPDHWHFTADQLQTAMQKFRDYRQRVTSSKPMKTCVEDTSNASSWLPVIAAEAIPRGDSTCEAIRAMLYRPLMCTFLSRCIQVALKNKSTKPMGPAAHGIVSRVIHMVTMQLHCHQSVMAAVREFSEEDERLGTSPQTGGPKLADLFSGAEEFFSCNCKTGETNCPSLELLSSLVDLWQSDLITDDAVYMQGLGYVLYHWSLLSSSAEEFLKSRHVSFDKHSESKPDKLSELERKKDAARKRAMVGLNSAAAKFKAAIALSDYDDEEDASPLESTTNRTQGLPSLEDGASECILCHELKGEPIGYLGYVFPGSKASKSTLLEDPQHHLDQLRHSFRVVCLEGANIHASTSESSPIVARLQQGDHVVVSNRIGRWVCVVQPVSGWCTVYRSEALPVEPVSSDADSKSKADYTVSVLAPVSSLLFNMHGAGRLQAISCHHAMHYRCWKVFSAEGRNVVRDGKLGEYLCPFCKGICNVLIPHVPRYIIKPTVVSSECNDLAKLAFGDDLDDDKQPDGIALDGATASCEVNAGSQNFLRRLSPSDDGSSTSTRLRDAIESFTDNWCPAIAGQSAVYSIESLLESFSRGTFNQRWLSWRPKTESDSSRDTLTMADSHSISSVHHLLSVVGHSISSTASCQRCEVEDEEGLEDLSRPQLADDKRHKEVKHCANLLMVARLTLAALPPMDVFVEGVLKPFRRMLSGRPSALMDKYHLLTQDLAPQKQVADFRLLNVNTCTSLDYLRMLMTLPFQVVATSAMPNPRRLYDILRNVRNDSEVCINSHLWAIFQKPLLSQDLNMVSIGAIGCATNFSSAEELVRIVGIARLTQILLEPMTAAIVPPQDCDKENAKRQKSGGDDLGSFPLDVLSLQVISLRVTARRSANRTEVAYPCDPALSGQELLRILLIRWIPFLEFSLLLLDCLDPRSKWESYLSSVDKFRQFDLPNLIPRAESLLRLIQLPTLPELLTSSELADLVTKWCQQYRDANSFIPEIDPLSKQSYDFVDLKCLPNDEPSESFAEESHEQSCSEALNSAVATGNGTCDSEDEEEALELNDEGDMLAFGDAEENGEGSDVSVDDFMDLAEHEVIPVTNQAGGIAGAPFEVDALAAQFGLDPSQALSPELFAFLQALQSGASSGGSTTSLAANRRTSGGSTAIPIHPWPFVGVDPPLTFIDDFVENTFSLTELSNLHSLTPLQGSLTGVLAAGGINGEVFPADSLFLDLSHLGGSLLCRATLKELPKLYTEVYRQVKFPYGTKEPAVEEPALCLVCGQVLNAGNRIDASRPPGTTNAGECTIHARTCGLGIGVFFLVQKCYILLIHDGHAAFYASPYLDSNGEGPNSIRGVNREMYLSKPVMRRVQDLYRRNLIPHEVSRQRSTVDQVIRSYYY